MVLSRTWARIALSVAGLQRCVINILGQLRFTPSSHPRCHDHSYERRFIFLIRRLCMYRFLFQRKRRLSQLVFAIVASSIILHLLTKNNEKHSTVNRRDNDRQQAIEPSLTTKQGDLCQILLNYHHHHNNVSSGWQPFCYDHLIFLSLHQLDNIL